MKLLENLTKYSFRLSTSLSPVVVIFSKLEKKGDIVFTTFALANEKKGGTGKDPVTSSALLTVH